MLEYGICCKQTLTPPAQIDLHTAARYLGAAGAEACAGPLLERCAPAVLASAAPRMVWCALPAALHPELQQGRDIAAHLAGCDTLVLLAVTLGVQTDTAVRRAAVGDVAAGAAADALASALAEQAAAQAEAAVRAEMQRRGLYLTGRFSPGYGDYPLSVQPRFAQLLDLARSLGVTVTPECLLLPRKSITALLGAADHPVSGKRAGCAGCVLRGRCSYRKRGITCEDDGTV